MSSIKCQQHKCLPTMAFKICLMSMLITLSAGSYVANHDIHTPQPYKFGYNINDHEGTQFRHEEGDGHGGVRGSYGFTDHRGIYREVHYVADHNGYRATVKTNEPGTANQNPAAVQIHSAAHPHHHHVPSPVHHRIPEHFAYAPAHTQFHSQHVTPYDYPVHHHIPHHV